MNVNKVPWNSIWWGESWVWLSIFCFLWIWISESYLLEMWRLIRLSLCCEPYFVSWLIFVHIRDFLSPESHWESMGFVLNRYKTVMYHCSGCALRTMTSHSLYRDYWQETDCGIESSVCFNMYVCVCVCVCACVCVMCAMVQVLSQRLKSSIIYKSLLDNTFVTSHMPC